MPRSTERAGWPAPAMEEKMTEHDKAVNEANAKVADYIARYGQISSTITLAATTISGLLADRAAAIAARDAAIKPRPLTAREGLNIYTPGLRICDPDLPPMQAVLDAAMERAVKAIEAQPRYTLQGATGASESHPHGAFVLRRDIRAALLPPNPLTKRD